MRNNYLSPSEARKRRLDRAGLALIAGCAVVLAGMFAGAAYLDGQRAAEVTSKPIPADVAARIEAGKWHGLPAVDPHNQPARIEGNDDSAHILAAITGELRKAGCQVREDSPHSYEVESC